MFEPLDPFSIVFQISLMFLSSGSSTKELQQAVWARNFVDNIALDMQWLPHLVVFTYRI